MVDELHYLVHCHHKPLTKPTMKVRVSDRASKGLVEEGDELVEEGLVGDEMVDEVVAKGTSRCKGIVLDEGVWVWETI